MQYVCMYLYLYLYLYECMSRHTATETPVELSGVQEYWVCVRVCVVEKDSVFLGEPFIARLLKRMRVLTI